MGEFDNLKLNTKILIISLIFVCFITVSAVSAINTITVTAKPSAGEKMEYKEYTTVFLNHCPLCNHSGTLSFNPKGTAEGEITCSHCDADYCAVTGKDKNGGGSRATLTIIKQYSNGTVSSNYSNGVSLGDVSNEEFESNFSNVSSSDNSSQNVNPLVADFNYSIYTFNNLFFKYYNKVSQSLGVLF